MADLGMGTYHREKNWFSLWYVLLIRIGTGDPDSVATATIYTYRHSASIKSPLCFRSRGWTSTSHKRNKTFVWNVTWMRTSKGMWIISFRRITPQLLESGGTKDNYLFVRRALPFHIHGWVVQFKWDIARTYHNLVAVKSHVLWVLVYYLHILPSRSCDAMNPN